MKRTMKKIIITLLILVLAGASYPIYRMIYEKTLKKQPRILVVLKTTEQSVEFWQIVKAGIEVAAREFDVNVEITGSTAESDITGQIQVLEKGIAGKPDVLVMAATDYNALVPVAEKIKKAHIPLITIDSGVNSDLPDSFIATDNIAAGKKVGETLASLLSPNAKIAIISHVKVSATAIEREQGVKLGLPKALQERLEGTYFCDGLQEKAYEITKDLLRKRPDVRGIASLNEPSTLGAAKAIKELNLSGQVKLVGFDSSIPEIKLIEEGVMQATVVQKPFNIGYMGIKTAVQVLKGKKVSKRIDTGSEIITRENMYSSENQKLLFPFVDR